MSCQAGGITGQIWAPSAGRSIEIVVADVGGDGCVHARDDAVKDTFLEARVVKGGRGGIGLKDMTEIIRGLSEGERGWRGARRREGEAVFSVNGVPDHVGTFTSVASEALWIVDEAHVVALGGSTFVFGNTVIALITFVIIFDNAAFTNALSESTLEGTLSASFFLKLAAWVGCFWAFQLAKFRDPPDFWYVFFIVKGVHGAGNVTTHAICVVPKWTYSIKEI